jgi:prephenate dehydrogenase
LTQFKTLLEEENYEAVYQEMHNTNRIKEILNGKK